jgi:transketolase
MAAGIALYSRLKNKTFHTYALLGNGECNEGAVWEAAMTASHYKLENITAIIDDNSMQLDGDSAHIMDISPIHEKFAAFGWRTFCVDGHDVPALHEALTGGSADGRPTAIIAKTIKGKGVSFMENNREWHHNRLTKSLYEQAVSEMEAAI